MKICPQCNFSNDDKYSFCLECGAALAEKTETSSEPPPTVLYPSEKFSKTEILPPGKMPTVEQPTQNDLPETVFYMPENPPPTRPTPPDIIPPTIQQSNPRKTIEQQNSPTESIEAPPTVLFTPDKTSSTARQSNPQIPATQYVPSESVETTVSPKVKPEEPEAVSETGRKSKKSGKIFLFAGIFLLLLLIGGGAAIYFLAAPMQEDKSYLLTDKHDLKDNILSLDAQNKTFTMVGADKNGFQRWQITPDPADKNFYRFVNRGVGEGESLEVVDDNYDSSVSMNRSAIDQGQLWAITNVEGDYYRITNQWLGDAKSLTHFKRNYYFLRIRDTNASEDGQLWKKVDSGDGQSFYLVNKQYGEKLTLEAFSGGEFQDKLAMTAKQSGYSPDNRWIQKDAGNGFVNLTTVHYAQNNANKLLAVNPNKNDRIAMTAAANSPGQSWKMIPVGSDGYFRLVNNSLGDGDSLEAVTFAQYSVEMVKSSDEDPGQLWKIERTSN